MRRPQRIVPILKGEACLAPTGNLARSFTYHCAMRNHLSLWRHLASSLLFLSLTSPVASDQTLLPSDLLGRWAGEAKH